MPLPHYDVFNVLRGEGWCWISVTGGLLHCSLTVFPFGYAAYSLRSADSHGLQVSQHMCLRNCPEVFAFARALCVYFPEGFTFETCTFY